MIVPRRSTDWARLMSLWCFGMSALESFTFVPTAVVGWIFQAVVSHLTATDHEIVCVWARQRSRDITTQSVARSPYNRCNHQYPCPLSTSERCNGVSGPSIPEHFCGPTRISLSQVRPNLLDIHPLNPIDSFRRRCQSSNTPQRRAPYSPSAVGCVSWRREGGMRTILTSLQIQWHVFPPSESIVYG